ncbi:hypothetical protein, partial [Staphylococcus aureus]
MFGELAETSATSHFDILVILEVGGETMERGVGFPPRLLKLAGACKVGLEVTVCMGQEEKALGTA